MSRRGTTTYDRTPRRRHAAPIPESRKRKRRVMGIFTGFLTTAALTAGVAYALITATATGAPEAVSSGKLSISLSNNGAGFSTSIANMMPADTVSRYVDVTNDGTADGVNLAVAVNAATANKLATDAVNGLRLTVSSCSGSWTPSTGACSGAITTVLTSTPIASLAGPSTVVSGVVPVGSVSRLRVTVALPDQSETTVNGSVPANSIQSLTNTLTFSFTLTQRPGVDSTS